MERGSTWNPGDMSPSDARQEWIAALPFSSGDSLAGRLSKLGGTLVLSDETLVFKPLGRLGRRKEIRLADIEAVDAFAEKPARLRVSPKNANPMVFAVIPTRGTPAWSDDASARDDAIAAIRSALRASA